VIAKVFKSTENSLLFALENLKKEIEKEFNDFDFLFFSIHSKYDYNDINYYIKKVFKNANYVAFNGIDAFVDNSIVEGVSCCVIKFVKNGKISTFFIEDVSFENSLTQTADYLNENKNKLHIMIGSIGSNKIKMGDFIEKLSLKLNYQPVNNIIGGISSGIINDNEAIVYQYIDNKIIKNGFVILSFENVSYEIGISLGFKPYGITYEVKKADNYKIYSVDDGKKFSDVIRNFMKKIDNKDIRYLWYTPIYLLDETDGYVATIRTIKDVKEEYVEFFGPVKRHQKFKFSFGDAEILLEEDKRNALDLKEKMPYPELIFNFSCIARQYVLEDKQREEIELYTSILNAHLFGFFTFGEIGPDKNFKKLKLYNETSLLLALEEI